eukprot:TRINITY_DN5252_c0_g1_i1.p1 TRINITY_DN5252_c0_g1~~TRINITY_DN5252_c0_g1_i1.p1  ORF type:complete len:447 (-),score=76.26 TRINITY_DN5252_c0_g1_i1:50-1390(-)
MNISHVQLLLIVFGIIIFNTITFYYFSSPGNQITITQTRPTQNEDLETIHAHTPNTTIEPNHSPFEQDTTPSLPTTSTQTITPEQTPHTPIEAPPTQPPTQSINNPSQKVDFPLPPRLKPAHKHAFVTMCTANYWKTCATLIQSFRDHSHYGMDTEFIVAVLPLEQSTENMNVGTVGWKGGELPQEANHCFDKLHASVRYIDKLPFPSTFRVKDGNWRIAWNKLRIWEWEEYEKLVYLDSDILVNSAIDEMVDFPDFSSSPGQCSPCEFQFKMNGGVLVLKPNTTVLKDMLHYGETTPRQDGWYLSEQMLLREYFLWGEQAKKGERPIYGHLLDHLYNQMMGSCRCLGDAVHYVKLWHFYCSNKPWSIPEAEWKAKKLASPKDCVNDIALKWYDTMRRSTTNCKTKRGKKKKKKKKKVLCVDTTASKNADYNPLIRSFPPYRRLLL